MEGTDDALNRLRSAARDLGRIHDELTARSRADLTDSYAAEWFLDNYYLVRAATRQVEKDLPRAFYRKLPRAEGADPGAEPRVHALAIHLAQRSQARLDMGPVEEEVHAYQQERPLTMGELWALPAMLRLVMVELLADSMRRIVGNERSAAGDQPSAARFGTWPEPVAASDDEQVANCIVSLRALRHTDWKAFFERLSVVHRTLLEDPTSTYPRMEFRTRDAYRKVVERIAEGAGRSEQDVAEAAVALAGEFAANTGVAHTAEDAPHKDSAELRRSHVGFYLLGPGVRFLEHRMGYQAGVWERWREAALGRPNLVYMGSVALVTFLLLALALRHAAWGGAGLGQELLVLLTVTIPAISIAVGVVNLVLGHLLKPKPLPKLDLEAGVPLAYRTVVAVPAMLDSAETVDELLRQLEQHHLGNGDEQVMFALLTDFPDADQENSPNDDALVSRALAGIRELNRRYGEDGVRPFYLFNRRRLWNEREGVWMGWERKRGKLMEFNRLLRGDQDTSYSVQEGDLSRLAGVEYVLTLDADTRLPPGAARRLIGTLAHPLNRAEFGSGGRVTAGYSLLQPRTDILPESANSTEYSRLFVGENGLDLYTLAVSDVYQDLFGSGIYVGKGLYRVDDFERALEGRVPENSVLSHDLLEGIYGRVGLVTDVVLYEDYPPTYLAQVLRMQRWVRGDWQLLPWLLGDSSGDDPAQSTAGRVGGLGALGAWQVFDNLRRSLLMPAMVLMLALGWTVLPGSPLLWTLMALGTLLVPLFGESINALIGALSAPPEARSEGRSFLPWRQLGDAAKRFVITVTFLPFEAIVVLKSVATTLYRLFVSRRQLLQWRTAAQGAKAAARLGLVDTAYRMLPALLLTVGLLLLVSAVKPVALWVAAPVIVLWLLAPLIAHDISRSLEREAEELSEADRRKLRRLARRTWLYFEQFVGPEDNWLPPDNVQVGGNPVTAHRTSPTNIGLLLQSTMTAHDLGYVGLVDLSLRLKQTMEVLGRLERYRGHILNWYDTRTLQPLNPRYVSSVDSGNLLGSLIALSEGCYELISERIVPERRWRGLVDTVDVLIDTLTPALGEGSEQLAHLSGMRQRVAAELGQPPAWPRLFEYLEAEGVGEMRRLLAAAMDEGKLSPAERQAARAWSERVSYNVRVTQREFDFLLPWNSAFARTGAWAAELPEGAAHTLRDLQELYAEAPTLRELEARCRAGSALLERFESQVQGQVMDAAVWASDLRKQLASCASAARGLVDSFESVAQLAQEEIERADFRFLYDEDRDLLRIGYNVDAERLDDNYYDLLASEARLGSLVAIAKGDLPLRHWLHLGRPLTDVNGRATLLSWSGTMFEYLMPQLLTKRYAGTLLEQSCDAAVDAQMAHAERLGIPWGMSESGYGRVDGAGTFQYRAFGVPQLALDRGQQDDVIVAPYASVLALGYRSRAVLDNLERLEGLGALGTYGLYEALDFTPSRKPLGRDYKLVSSYMAHHQGMILEALAGALTGGAMVRRFHSNPRIATVELLLQEKVPTKAPVDTRLQREQPRADPIDVAELDRAWEVHVQSPTPEALLLSNGHYSVLLTSAGAGHSSYDDVAVTRPLTDGTLEDLGSFVYLHDQDSGALWSATAQPTGRATDQRAEFAPHRATFTRAVEGVLSTLEVTVAEEAAELRRVTLINQSDRPRRLKLTSYAEVVVGDPASDRRHPAFSKLFVESRYLPELGALMYRRRPRSAEEHALYAAHALLDDATASPPEDLEYESDRAAFLGRGNSLKNPAGPRGRLGGGVGATLDPVMALATTVELAPHSQKVFTFVTAYGDSSGRVEELLRRLQRGGAVEREFELARSRSRQELRRARLTAADLRSYQHLLSLMLFPAPPMRAANEVLRANELGQSGLWGQGISGDYPVLLVRAHDQEELQLIAEIVRAHSYWRRRGVKVDVVILNTKESGYSQDLQGKLRWLLSRTGGDDWLDARGGIYLLRQDQLADVDLTLLQSVARVVLDTEAGTLAQQLSRAQLEPEELPELTAVMAPAAPDPAAGVPGPTEQLQFFNGLGGFSEDGREYVIRLPGGELPPAPWSNVVANEQVGFLATEGGLGSSWAINSGENRITPWHNDPVTDPPAEVAYLRDEETAEVWSATPLPSSRGTPFEVRHGPGYTLWRQHSRGLRQELEAFVAAEDPVKLVRLRVTNESGRPRRLTVTYLADWVLGLDRSATQLHVVPSYDAGRSALLATNRYNAEFGDMHAFLASNKSPHGVTTDRREFYGRHGDRSAPAALRRIGLSGEVRAGTDPCAAIQLHLDLEAGGSEEVLFVLGEAEGRERALELLDRYRDMGRLEEHRAAANARWQELLGQLRVETPDAAMNLLTNGWLTYQTVAARLWGRSAFYQSSGAYGFRDQLQDVLAVLYTEPRLAREQLLRAAAHQFQEGDVLHWWHPPSGRGVRTRITDDLAWLPYVASRYVEVTGDVSVLDEQVPFLTGPTLGPDDHERYDHYPQGGQGSLLEHCLRALKRASTKGRNGLPLMGGGDWNDGMNRVGVKGQGESVWLCWFLIDTLRRFARTLRTVNRADEAAKLEARAEEYVAAAETSAWDGDWYLRAFYDDGSPLGTHSDLECQIDSIAQSWSVMALGDHERGRTALRHVDERLVREEDGLIRLFSPAFDRTTRDPGYIKGYLPGVRENGGQYTHGAIWTAWAFALLGDADRAHQLYELLSPVRHGDSPEAVATYKVEPYVIAADVYSLEPHVGRGGWTWYTGSASWFYRLGVEAILGLNKVGDELEFQPHLPSGWSGYSATWRQGGSSYLIEVRARREGANTAEPPEAGQAAPAVRRVTLDGRELSSLRVPLVDDGAEHQVVVELG